jgi:hypothetical protein
MSEQDPQVATVGDDPLEGLSPENRAIIERQARALKGESRAQRAANADPLPGPLKGLFAPDQAIAGLRVRKLVHFDFVLLRRLQSPLLKQLERKSRGKTSFSDEQGYEMVWQFTRPPLEVEAALNKLGLVKFREMAKQEIGLTIGPVEMALLVKAVEAEFVRAFSTVIKYGAPDKSEGRGETVFTGPAMTPAPKTGSAGG